MAPLSASMLDDALSLLASSTVTDRNKGIDQFSTLLTNRSNLNNVKDSRWAEIFHQLFSVAEAEKSSVLNQSTSRKRPVSKVANLNRLSVVTSLIRKCVSGFACLFKHKTTRLVVNRTLELMVGSHRTMMDAVTMDGVRILRDLFSYRPHAEHLNPGTSSEILAICFAVILDRKLSKDFMLLNNVDFVQAGLSSKQSGAPSRQCAANPSIIEAAYLLSIVLPASPSVCLECSKSMLSDFFLVLSKFPRETSAHFHLISALHTFLQELELNKGEDLSQWATQLGHCLINLWPSKNSSLKEQIILCLTYLLPFVIRNSEAETNQENEISSDAITLLKKVLGSTSNIIEFHPKSSSIPLSTLRLMIPPEGLDSSFFNTRAFSLANWNGTDSASDRFQVIIWAALRLGASALACVTKLTHRYSTQVVQTSSKRRKVDDELDIFLHGLKPGSPPAVITHRLQLLIVAVDLHWNHLPYGVHVQITESILELLNSRSEPVVLDWVFVLLGTLAHCVQPAKVTSLYSDEANLTDSIVPSPKNWHQIWTFVIHRTANPVYCRSASFAAFCILITGQIPSHAAHHDVCGYLRDLQVHAPPFPYDSVCLLMSQCLALAAESLQMSAHAFEDKVLLWLAKIWPEVDRSVGIGSLVDGYMQRNRRSLPVGFDCEAILLLFTSIAKLPHVYQSNLISSMPDCATTNAFTYLEATLTTRSSIFPCPESNTSKSSAKPNLPSNQASRSNLVPHGTTSTNVKQEISAMLHHSLEKILEGIEDRYKNTDQLLSVLSCAHVQIFIKMLILILQFEVLFQPIEDSIDQESIKLIESYFEVIISLVESSKWTPPESSMIFNCFGPILLYPSKTIQEIQHDGLALPGAASGIVSDQRLRSQPDKFGAAATLVKNISNHSTPGYEWGLPQVWSAHAAIQSKFEAFSTMCERLLQAICLSDPSAALVTSAESQLAQTQVTGITINFDEEEDITGGAPSQTVEGSTIDDSYFCKKKTLYTALGSSGNHRATLVVTSVCIRAMVTCLKISRNPKHPEPTPSIISMLGNCQGSELIYLGNALLDCVLGGLITLTADHAETLLQNLGENYLRTYAYSQNINVRKFAIQLIQTTLCFWKNSTENVTADVKTMARQLADYLISQMLTGNSRSWEVHHELSILLDAYIRWDPLQAAPLYLSEGEEDEEGLFCPSALMLRFLQDQDFRVRHRAALFVSRVFDLLHHTSFDPVQYWRQVVDHLWLDSTELEVMLTSSLCVAHIFVLSEIIRPRAYSMLLDFLMKPQDSFDEVNHYKLCYGLLQRAACQLGFASVGDIYKLYAAHVAFERQRRNVEPLHFNERFVGHQLNDRQKAGIARVHLLNVGPRFYLNNDLTGFQISAELAGLDEQGALQLCAPVIVAEVLARACIQAASTDAIISIDHLVKPTLKTMTEFLNMQVDVIEVLSVHVVVYLMCSVHVTSEDMTLISKVIIADSAQRNVFEVLSSKLRKQSLSEPALPFYPMLRIAQVMKWLGVRYSLFSEPGLVYNIICRAFTSLTESHFNNDRLRILHSLSIYISFSHRTISCSLPILSLLLQALISLVSYKGIFQSVCPFLRWTFGKILLPSNPDLKGHASMGHLIISVVELMKRVADSSSSELDASSAKEFNAWSLNHIAKTSNSGQSEYQRLCHSLLLNWPEKHVIPVDDSAIKLLLKSFPGPTFKLIHHLNDQNFLGNAEEKGKILYNLLSSAQDLKTEIDFEECQRYLELLYQNSGILTLPQVGHSAQPYKKSNFDPNSSELEDQIISQIFTMVISRLQTSNFRQMRSITEFLREATNFENLPQFCEKSSLVTPLLIERAVLACHNSTCWPHSPYQIPKTEQALDFVLLDQFAHSTSTDQWTYRFLQLLIASRAEARPFYTQLIPLVETNDELAAQFLPRVLHSCLLAELGSATATLRTKVSNHISTILTSRSANHDVITRVINLLTYLRSHERPGTDPLGRDKWLDVSWLKLAEQATRRGMSASGFLFLEVAREHGLSIDLSKPVDQSLQFFLEQLFTSSSESDTFYSLIPSDPRNFLLQRYQHERRWESAFGYHGAILEGLSSKSLTFSKEIPSVAGYLSAYGLNRLAHTVLHTYTFSQDFNSKDTSGDENSTTLPFELAWRASVWDLPVMNQLNSDSSTRIYGTLRSCYCDREKSVKLDVAKSAMLGQFKELIQVTADRVQPTSQAIGSALALRDIVTWLGNEQDDVSQTLVCLPPDCQYDVLERISAVRRSLLQVVTCNTQIPNQRPEYHFSAAREAELKLRIETSQVARHCGNLQSAINIITPFSDLIDDDKAGTALKAKEEFAEVLWAKGEKTLALNTLKVVHASQKSLPQAALQLCRIGEWISSARLNSSKEIVDSYFEKALQNLDSSKHSEAYGQVSYTYAKLADAEYHKLLRSGEVQKLTASTEQLQAEIDATAQLSTLNPDIRKMIKRKKRLYQEDHTQLQSLSELQNRYLTSSLKMYLACLAYCDQGDDAIFRVVSIWLDHHSNETVNEVINLNLRSVPTHKFIRVANQLSARLCNEPGSEFQKILGRLIFDLCKDHPFHIVFQIMLIQRGIQSACLDGPSNSRSRRTSQIPTATRELSSSEFSRAQAADNILNKISQHESRQDVIKQLIVVHKAYKEWALVQVPSPSNKNKSQNQMPSKMLLNSLKNLSVPVPTERIPIDKTCRYMADSMACITGYDPTFKLASGVHRPKITKCLASNGISYVQLFKGGDDIRQDAIMEQVFELVNEILKRDPECQKRMLNFKTYNAIALSPDAGVIEFVQNTMSLAEVLIPVHCKYNEPPDWSFTRLREYLSAAQTSETRIQRYREILPHCRPAMRFWFMETQKCPREWFEMRLNFARSVATTSIVGHILGLGDRHLSNILVDKKTGEVVQIDLGIAFDEGKQLPIPELVPFRLSRDMVDGFGVAKTEGVFRRCCEQTLRVMRENKSLIMTIMDVLKHDALKSWIATEQEENLMKGVREHLENNMIGNNQNRLEESEIRVSEQALRALSNVENKLSSDLNVETTVNQLILEATSIENLGSIFHGWSAYY